MKKQILGKRDNILIRRLFLELGEAMPWHIDLFKNGSHVNFADRIYRVNIDCNVGDELVENNKEIFLPFRVNKFPD
jgi:hypothetical protein